MHRWLVPEKGHEVDGDKYRSLRYKKVHKKLDDPKILKKINQLAKSRTAGIWRIKRAKIILNTLKGKNVDRMVLDIRVPPESIIKCQQEFGTKGISYFNQPARNPTKREARVEKILLFLEKSPSCNSILWDTLNVKYIGYYFSARQIMQIRKLIENRPELTTGRIASALCAEFGLYQANGELKQGQMIKALVRMQMDNLIVLPRATKQVDRAYSKLKFRYSKSVILRKNSKL